MKRVSRRVFLAATATTAIGLVACSERTPPQPPLIKVPETPTRRPSVGVTAVPPPSMQVPTSTPGKLAPRADGYVALTPRIMRSGQTETVALTLLHGEQPAMGNVAIVLTKDGKTVAETSGAIRGHGILSLTLPAGIQGEHKINISGETFKEQAAIRVESGAIIFVESDKPIYKPGQTIHLRVLVVDSNLRPTGGEVEISILDATGIKVFKQKISVDEFGMATLELPLSDEPNLGVWKVQATLGQRSSEIDVRVERYVLPKYEVKATMPKTWALPSEPIKGTVSAEYSFGKPVRGEAEIVATRFVGDWQEYARVTRPIEGKTTFELPPTGYATGTPGAGGLAQVRIDITVREEATGYEGQTSELITIAPGDVVSRVVPESKTFKPGLPFSVLIVTETPDKRAVDATVKLDLNYQGENYDTVQQDSRTVTTRKGIALVSLTAPDQAVKLSLQPSIGDTTGPATTIGASYSPSSNFIHIEQVSSGDLHVGNLVQFKISSTHQSTNFYYEVLARGTVVFSDVVDTTDISFSVTPQMSPEARLLVYQLLPNTEVAADYLPFNVVGEYPHKVDIHLEHDEVRPGDALDVAVQTEGPARVGLVAVDRSVFILAENRLNLQQVFDELERLYMEPQAELHDPEPNQLPDFRPMPGLGSSEPTEIPGAKETFEHAGMLVLTNRQIPEGKQLQPMIMFEEGMAMPAAVPDQSSSEKPQSLAQPSRVRQFFPETWIWSDITTSADGRAHERVTAPDSITTWMLRAVALSKEQGLGIAEGQLRVFQPFFVQVDLPYSAIRGEEFPVKIALYNYGTSAEDFQVDLEAADWFTLLDKPNQTVSVAANSVGAVTFQIQPKALGVRSLKITARSRSTADAIIKELIVEPEGVSRENVDNLQLAPDTEHTFDLATLPDAITGSQRALVALTGNVLSQTIDGLEKLLQIPFGCGEQNMILFAPNVFITRYLKETNQIKPEISAKAEKLMLTGYQRELTYRRDDASFSAFGQQDADGSLWLTAFVLKTFAQAQGLIYIDDTVLQSARDWITAHQQADGSFASVGFLHHQELMGGLNGKAPLTAYVAIALREAGDDAGTGRAIKYLEQVHDTIKDAYGTAITAYALALAKSGRANVMHDRLMALAHQSDSGLWWGDLPILERPQATQESPVMPETIGPSASAAIETTGYAALALLQAGDRINAGHAVRWLAGQRNAYGGFGSTQDTIVALQAMANAASSNRTAIDTTITLRAGDWHKDVRITPGNADVLQSVEVPIGSPLTIAARGTGQTMVQVVQRFNVPQAVEPDRSIFKLDVSYDTDKVAVDDRISITAKLTFTPPPSDSSRTPQSGMVVLDVAIPTGFDPVAESLDSAVKREPKLKRWEAAGRKVILYIEDMAPGAQIQVSFQAQALYPVRAQAVASQAYSYYRPEWRGESLGIPIVVAGSS